MLNSVLDVDDKIYKLQLKANLRENLKILSHCYIAFAFLMNELFGLKKRQVGFLYLDRNLKIFKRVFWHFWFSDLLLLPV